MLYIPLHHRQTNLPYISVATVFRDRILGDFIMTEKAIQYLINRKKNSSAIFAFCHGLPQTEREKILVTTNIYIGLDKAHLFLYKITSYMQHLAKLGLCHRAAFISDLDALGYFLIVVICVHSTLAGRTSRILSWIIWHSNTKMPSD